MKKTYEKPLVLISEFALNENIMEDNVDIDTGSYGFEEGVEDW